MRLKDKVAIVTGAAGGMGAATARIFAKEGAKVVLTDLNEGDGLAVANEIGPQAIFVKHDVATEADWHKVADTAVKTFGRIDVLVNNAGVSGSDPDRLSMATWDQQMSINAKGVFLGLRTILPIMQKQQSGSVVNISSISGIVGQSFVHMGYNAAKGAVRTMTKTVAVQYAADGIRCNSIHPGIMPPMKTSRLSADPVVREKTIRAIPMKREGRIEEVAYASLFLASDEASYITGIEVPVDGGFLAQ